MVVARKEVFRYALATAANLRQGKLARYLKDQTVTTGHSRVFHVVPLGYWETCDARQWGVIESISEKSLWIRSDVSMSIGAELRIKVFCRLGYDFDDFRTLIKITGKEPCWEGGLEAFEYELEFIVISEEDRLKLGNSIRIREEARKSVLGRG